MPLYETFFCLLSNNYPFVSKVKWCNLSVVLKNLMDESQGIVGTKLCRSYKFLEKGIRNVPVEFMIL